MRRKPEGLNIFNRCVWKKPGTGKRPPPSGGSTFDLLQYVYENGGARKVIVKQRPPPSLEEVAAQRQHLSVLEKCFESEEEEEPRFQPVTLKRFFEESPEKPRTLEKMDPLDRALFLCLNLHLELPGWVLFGLGKSALAPVWNEKPRTGRHTYLDKRLDQLDNDFCRWEKVEEILKDGSPRAPGRKMTVNDAIEEAGDRLQGTSAGSKKNIANVDAVRKSYFRVKKNWMRYCLAVTALHVGMATSLGDPTRLRRATIYMESYHARLRKELA